MKLAIFGFKNSGKSTVFDALTGEDAGPLGARTQETRLRSVPVPDPRLERLRTDYKPKKFTPATVNYVDFPGFGGDEYFGELRTADALIGVVRGFKNPSVMERNERIDWKADFSDLVDELIVADYVLVEKQLARLKKATRFKASKDDEGRLAILERLLPLLEEGKPATELELNADERELVRGYAFLSLKPRIMVVNLDDDTDLAATGLDPNPDFAGDERPASLTFPIRARLEAEVAQLEEDERAEFLTDFGIEEVISARLIRISYAYLNLISFLTAGEKEVHAWTIRRGTTAVVAAGKIHTDIQRSFIRAEITSWADYEELGSVKAAKEAKKWRLEAKGYVVQDGDMVEFRHGG